jgi:hypothetical protein
VTDTNNYIEETTDRVYAEMKASDPASNPAERLKRGMETAMEDMMGAYAEALTGSRRLLSDAEIDGLRINAGAALGYTPAAMVATAGGVVLPIPYEPSRARNELAPEQLQSFVHWLPEEDRERRSVPMTLPDGTSTTRPENADEYAARLFAMGVARGVLHPDGSNVDVLSLHGLDIADAAVKVRVEAWQAGNADSILDNLQIGAIDDALEARLIAAAQAVANSQARTPSAGATPALPGSTALPVAPPPVTPLDAGMTSQLVLAVNAARELLEDARRSGSSGPELATAASKVAATIERLEANQEELVGKLSASMTDSLEKQLALQAGRDTEFNAKFEELFSAGVESISDRVGELREVLGSFAAGMLPMTEAVNRLSGIVNEVNESNAESSKKVAEAIANQSRIMNDWGKATRGGATYTTPSAKDAVEGSGIGEVPK